MPQTGDKCNDLFLLSKNIKQVKNHTDRSTIEIEFEKNKEECTFKPHINHNKSPSHLHQNQAEIIDRRSPRSIKDLRGAMKSIERM